MERGGEDLKIMYTNTGGITVMEFKLENYISEKRLDIMGLVETKVQIWQMAGTTYEGRSR